jgi:hypothetical protein
MKTFTQSDIKTITDIFKKYPDYLKIYCEQSDLVITGAPLNRSRSGYGAKLPTSYKINFNGKNYRVYCSIYSNIGTCYFVTNKKRIVVG